MNQQTDYSQILLAHNIKPSYQRIKILEYLSAKRHHPTVEDIYQVLVKSIPTLSRTTIYNNLKLFSMNQLVRVVNIKETEALYDAVTDEHGHFRCEHCDLIVDFPITEDNFKSENLAGYKIHTRDMYFKGLCPDCLEIIDNKK